MKRFEVTIIMKRDYTIIEEAEDEQSALASIQERISEGLINLEEVFDDEEFDFDISEERL